MEHKTLYRSRNNRMICGVCGGIGEYFNIDATLIRLLLVVLACTGSGILAYFIAAIIIPDQDY
ncbi:MAG: PspC domain-containing protein [Hespellia sp.]|nr:PspC domain-containing protein [Hespellia sp.]